MPIEGVQEQSQKETQPQINVFFNEVFTDSLGYKKTITAEQRNPHHPERHILLSVTNPSGKQIEKGDVPVNVGDTDSKPEILDAYTLMVGRACVGTMRLFPALEAISVESFIKASLNPKDPNNDPNLSFLDNLRILLKQSNVTQVVQNEEIDELFNRLKSEEVARPVKKETPEEQKPPEKMDSRITLLDNLDTLLSPKGEPERLKLYYTMMTNEHVAKSGYKPSIEQFEEYLRLCKKGFEYVKDTYGEKALPGGIRMYEGPMRSGDTNADWIGYLPERDEFSMSFLHIASQAAGYDDSLRIHTDYHLSDTGFSARDYTVLQAIEEGYHRYQIEHLGMKAVNTNRNIQDPLEAGIVPVFNRAISDLGIQAINLPKELTEKSP